MTSPKGGKNKLKHHSPVKKILKGKGAANDKGKKRNMTRKDIADYLEWAVFEKESPKKASPKKASPKKASPKKASPKKASPKKASPKKASPKKASPIKVLPRKPRLPLTKREKEILKVIKSINNLGL
jgi:hypothetical protein